MRLPFRHRRIRLGAIFKKHNQSNERSRRVLTKRAISIGHPEVVRGADGLCRSAVEVIAKGRAYLRLELKRCDELLLMHYEQIPNLRRPKKSRQGQSALLRANVGMSKTIVLDEYSDEGKKTIHVLARRHRSARSDILMVGFKLFILRGCTIVPKDFHRIPNLCFLVCRIKVHFALSIQQFSFIVRKAIKTCTVSLSPSRSLVTE